MVVLGRLALPRDGEAEQDEEDNSPSGNE